MKTKQLLALAALIVTTWLSPVCLAQVNSGSNGSDGAFNPTTNTVINMADHPNGIYQYTSVNISNGITVTFIPNANNTPVVWLVQSNCTIAGILSVNGSNTTRTVVGAQGGPGGWRAGNAALSSVSLPGTGLGLGGGTVGTEIDFYGGNASYGTRGGYNTNQIHVTQGYANDEYAQFPPGPTYGTSYLLPLLGGSGGSGGRDTGGGGGGGAILIAGSGDLIISGSILSCGGNGDFFDDISGNGRYYGGSAGAGSGGAIRLIATSILGSGNLDTSGGQARFGSYWCNYSSCYYFNYAGNGRIRLDGLNITFNGQTTGVITRGFQPIIIPVSGQDVQLSIASVAGASVSATPSGQLVSPDAIVAGQQANPIPIVVHCANLPLNTLITVTVKPANGASVNAVGYNTTGTLASSTATVSLNMPRGGGIIYATAATSN